MGQRLCVYVLYLRQELLSLFYFQVKGLESPLIPITAQAFGGKSLRGTPREHLLSQPYETLTDEDFTYPSKVVSNSISQFCASTSSGRNFRAESARFIGDSHIPYTRNGRAYNPPWCDEEQIPALIHWKAEPLPSIK